MTHRTIVIVAAAAVLALLIAGSAPAGLSKVDGGIEFTYDDPSAGSVSLAGNFNNWNMSAEKLTLGSDGVWRVVVDLAPGEYEYKFVVNGSEWVADPENPRIVGDYGNSGLTVNDDGEPVTGGAAEAISNTPVNSRVKLNGWYRATYVTQADAPDDPRLRLRRPEHEFYIGVNPTVTSVASGSAMVRLSTGYGYYKEISADIYSGHVVLEGGPFTVTGYYNEEVLQFDDPQQTVGHIDLPYTIQEEHIPFGRGAQGIILNTDFLDIDLTASYSNIYDYYIMNDPSVYDNTDTDLIAARAKRSFGPVTLGATYASLRDGWWIGFDNEANSDPHIEAYWDSLPVGQQRSNWFELSNTQTWMGLDVKAPVLDDLFQVAGEYATYNYDSRWDVGNMVKVEGESYSNGEVDIPVGDMDGWVTTGVLHGAPLPGLDVRLEVKKTWVDSMTSGEEYIAYGYPYWLAEWKRQFFEVKGTNSPLTVNVFGPAPERDELQTKLDATFGFGIFDLGFEYDYRSYEWTYRDEFKDEPLWSEFGDFYTFNGGGTRVAASGQVNLTDRVKFGLALESLEDSYDIDFVSASPYVNNPKLRDPSTLEIIATADVGLWWEDWSFLVDVRSMRYSDFAHGVEIVGGDTLLIDYAWDVFVAPYAALVYEPRENIELRVGYGINPTNYLDTPVEGRGNGRERWLSELLWERSDYDILDAEKAMSEAKVISAMAVITF